MDNNMELLFRRGGRAEGWEQEERDCYDLDVLREEYRERLYSDEGRQLIEISESPPPKLEPNE